MRWNNLQLIEDVPADGALPLFARGAVVRRFDTPDFRGVTFYEVQARSALNRVPDASRVPFRWTVNPYRGCTHACRYCLHGDTPILMADGRTKPLASLRVGDSIYGTLPEGSYRRYVITQVLAHWSTVKPAYRVTLEDGTQLVASGDHRFLTDRGWKHVTGAMSGPLQRPYLTANNKVMGTGAFAEPPKDSSAYRIGYLCGLVRGDGHLGPYSYSHGDVHRFGLALVDSEALDRTSRYLADRGITTTELVFQPAGARRAQIVAIRAYARESVDKIRDLLRWPPAPSLDWSKGFLAGIFDSEGSYGQTVLRIANTDREIIDHTTSALDRLGFGYVVEQTTNDNGLAFVRLRGGLQEILRFFHTVDPAITRKRTIAGIALKHRARLGVASIEPLGLDLPMYDIATGTGDFIANGVVSHNCFARKTHEYLDLDSGHDFDTQIVVKVNVVERLRADLARPSWRREHVALGTNVDPYQRAEGRYGLMPGIIEALAEARTPFSVLTKATLILRDVDRLINANRRVEVGTAFSVGFLDETLWRSVEPGTPAPTRRLDACKSLSQAGLRCGVLMAPILPYLTDTPESLESTVAAIAAAGAAHVTPIVLHLRPGAREWYGQWLRTNHPDLVPKYEALYRNRSYAPNAYQSEIGERVRQLAAKYGVGEHSPVRFRTIGEAEPPPAPAEVADQLTLY